MYSYFFILIKFHLEIGVFLLNAKQNSVRKFILFILVTWAINEINK